MEKKIRMGVIGLGGISPVHISGIINSPDAELVAICDIDASKLEQSQKKLAIATELCFADYHRLIDCDKVDAVSICTPNDSHYPIALYAIQRHKPFALEKPVTLEVAEAQELEKLATEAKIPHMVCFSYRFKSAARYARHLVQAGTIGNVVHLYAQYNQSWGLSPEVPLYWRFIKARTGTGALGDLGSHMIDLIRFTVGEIAECTAICGTVVDKRTLEDKSGQGTVDVDDYYHGLLVMKNGATGTFTTSRLTYGRGNYQSLEIHGTLGAIQYNLEHEDCIRICYGEPLARENKFVELRVPDEFSMNQMQQFFDICNGRGDGLAASLHDGLATQEVIEAMVVAAGNSQPTRIERKDS